VPFNALKHPAGLIPQVEMATQGHHFAFNLQSAYYLELASRWYFLALQWITIAPTNTAGHGMTLAFVQMDFTRAMS
jgi:hypothetical protein